MPGLKVIVVTPAKQVARAEVDQVVAPSVMGQVTILPLHRPLLADLAPGIVELRTGASAEKLAVSGGFLEFERNTVTLLVETAERPGEIDRERSQKALQDSEAQLKKLSPTDPAYAEAQGRAERARARLQLSAS
jgi:F-type H+-transporting ATPase subunit epsilon